MILIKNKVALKLLHLANDRKYSMTACGVLLVLEAILLVAIIHKVPYTEIDWKAYMEQAALILEGEYDYSKIVGGTGPMVYPGGHARIFTALYDVTSGGENVRLAQYIYAAVYLGTQFFAFTVYLLADAPPYLFPLLCLSKRLHSIYVLRLFNDVFGTFAMTFCVFTLQNQMWLLSGLWISLAIGIKMNFMLYLPAFLLITLQGMSRNGLLVVFALSIVGIQVFLALPFCNPSHDHIWSYLAGAFDISRAFMWKWTVNWRFIGQKVFENRKFHGILLWTHLTVLIGFACTIWNAPSGYQNPFEMFFTNPPPAPRGLTAAQRAEWDRIRQEASGNEVQFDVQQKRSKREEKRMQDQEEEIKKQQQAQQEGREQAPLFYSRTQFSTLVTQEYVFVTMATCNLIGVLFARSLHYQFYSWFYWTVPFLLYRATYAISPLSPLQSTLRYEGRLSKTEIRIFFTDIVGLAFIFGTWALQEYAWNVYPSTYWSSLIVVGCIAITVIGVYVSEYRYPSANNTEAPTSNELQKYLAKVEKENEARAMEKAINEDSADAVIDADAPKASSAAKKPKTKNRKKKA